MTTTATRPVLSGAATFWYVMMNIAFGAAYLSKIPVKKALSELGLCELTGAETFWYVLECIGFGSGYFAKVITKKALSELPQYHREPAGKLSTLAAP
jgi:hypothetical protein